MIATCCEVLLWPKSDTEGYTRVPADEKATDAELSPSKALACATAETRKYSFRFVPCIAVLPST